MIEVLGLPLELARARLERKGYAVETCEVRARKDAAGNELRVIRQTELPGRRVLLEYARFLTDAASK